MEEKHTVPVSHIVYYYLQFYTLISLLYIQLSFELRHIYILSNCNSDSHRLLEKCSKIDLTATLDSDNFNLTMKKLRNCR